MKVRLTLQEKLRDLRDERKLELQDVADATGIPLATLANNCTKSKVKELKNYHKDPCHRVEVVNPNCKSRATKCIHFALMSEANHMCMGGCGTQ